MRVEMISAAPHFLHRITNTSTNFSPPPLHTWSPHTPLNLVLLPVSKEDISPSGSPREAQRSSVKTTKTRRYRIKDRGVSMVELSQQKSELDSEIWSDRLKAL